jgi:hypothetical protein
MYQSSGESLQETLSRAFRDYTTIVLKSPLLRETGEEKLETIVDRLLRFLGHPDLIGPVYAAVRELVQNASKANLKRLLFEELRVDPNDSRDYLEGMSVFRQRLIQSRIKGHADLFRARGFYFKIAFQYNTKVLCIRVINPFPLFAAEERRIREKFLHAAGADNLYEFYLRHGDAVEGAGMGIAMVQILLCQAGFSHRALSIYSEPARGQTVSRIILPLDHEYISPRERFAQEQRRRGISAEELRSEMWRGGIAFPMLSSVVERRDESPARSAEI